MKGKPKKLCVVKIGYQHFLLDAEQGLRLLKAVSDAVHVSRGYDQHQDGDDYHYVIGDPMVTEFTYVKETQLRTAPGSFDLSGNYQDHKLLPAIERKFLPRPKP